MLPTPMKGSSSEQVAPVVVVGAGRVVVAFVGREIMLVGVLEVVEDLGRPPQCSGVVSRALEVQGHGPVPSKTEDIKYELFKA